MASFTGMLDWATLWDGEFSDMTLELRVKGRPESTCCKAAHKFNLNAKSEYFRNRLLNQEFKDCKPGSVPCAAVAGNGSKQGRAKKRQKVASPDKAAQAADTSLTLTVECDSVEEQAACLAALKHAYTGELPAAADDIKPLTAVCKQADYLRMPATVDACLDALCKVAAQPQLSPQLCSQVLALPHDLPEQLLAGSNSGKTLQQQLHTVAVKQFGNVVDIIRDQQLQQQFVALPFALLLHWASLDELVTDSENTIAVLMHLWVKHNSNARLRLPGDQAQQLSSMLRIPQTSIPFHSHALPKLPWYKPRPELPAEHAMLCWAHEWSEEEHECTDELSDLNWDVPRAVSEGVTIEWALNTAWLQQNWANPQSVQFMGPSAYYAGYTCQLSARLDQVGGQKALGVYVKISYCPMLSPWCQGPSYAPMSVEVEAGQGGRLHAYTPLQHAFQAETWGLRHAVARHLHLEGGLQELAAYSALPIKVVIKMLA